MFTFPITFFSSSASGYQIPLSVFDGTNDYLSRGADFTGLVDGKSGILSFWVVAGDTSGATEYLYNNTGDYFRITINTSGVLAVIGFPSAGGAILRLDGTAAIDDGVPHHIMASWDLATAAGHLYVDGVTDLSSSTLTNNTIDYARGNQYVGAAFNATSKFSGSLGQFYLNFNNYIDLSNSTNRAKFYNGNPVDFGADGSTPTGSAPILFLNNVYTSFQTNLGSGGGTTLTGTLADGGTYP